jgi:hypothetical protein
MAAISGRLLTMAWNYLNTEDSVASSFSGTPINTTSGMQKPEGCEPSNAYASLPAVTGAKQTSDIPVISRFWPQGAPDKLRAAARTQPGSIQRGQVTAHHGTATAKARRRSRIVISPAGVRRPSQV